MNKIILYTIALLLHCITAYSQQIIQPKWTTANRGGEFAFSDDRSKVLQIGNSIASLVDTHNGIVTTTLRLGEHGIQLGCFSQSGKKIATVNQGKSISIWDAYTGEQLSTYNTMGSKGVIGIAFCNNESCVLITNYDYTAAVWDIEGAKKIREFGHGDEKVLRSHDELIYERQTLYGDLLATTDNNGVVKLWNTNTGQMLHILDEAKGSQYCMFSDDGKSVVCYGTRNTSVFNTESGNAISVFEDINGQMGQFAQNGKKLFIQASGGVCVLDVIAQKVLRWFSMQDIRSRVLHFEADRLGNKIAIHDTNGEVGIWNVPNGNLIVDLYIPKDFYAAKFLDSTIIIAEKNAGVKVWNSQTGKLMLQTPSIGDGDRIYVNKKHTHILTVSNQYIVHLLDNSNGKTLSSFGGMYKEYYKRCIFNSPGDKIAIATDLVVEVRDLNGNLQFKTDKFTENVVTLCFYNLSDILIVGYENNVIRVWDTYSGKKILDTRLNATGIGQIIISPDDKTLAIIHSGNDLSFFSTEGVEIKKLDDSLRYFINDFFFSSNGKYIAVVTNTRTTIWEAATGNKIFTKNGYFSAINRQENRCAVAEGDSVTLWNLNSGKHLITLKGHYDEILEVCFNNIGNRIVTISSDLTARLWDTEQGIQLAYLSEGYSGTSQILCDSNVLTIDNQGIIRQFSIDIEVGKQNRFNLSQWSKCNCSHDDLVKDFVYTGSALLASTASGVIRSTDNGKNWVSVSNEIPDKNIKTIEVIQDTVYVGTESGLFYSGNNGDSWTKSKTILGEISAMETYNDTLFISVGSAIVKLIPNINSAKSITFQSPYMFNSVSISDNVIYLATNNGVVRSTDNGTTWAEANNGIIDKNLKAIFAHSDHVFAISYNNEVFHSSNKGNEWNSTQFFKPYLPSNIYFIDNNVFITTLAGLYSSSNNGESWESFDHSFPEERAVISLWKKDNTFLLGGWGFGIHYSEDNGKNWLRTGSHCRPFYDIEIIHNRIYGYGSEIWESTDSTNSWSRTMHYGKLQGDEQYLFRFDRLNDQLPLRSTDNGANWTEVKRPDNVQYLYDYLYHNEILYIGSNRGVSISSDYGETWNTTTHTDTIATRLSLFENTVSAEYSGSTLYYTSDSGKNWKNSNLIFESSNGVYFIHDTTILAANDAGLIGTTNAGKTWKTVGLRPGKIIGLTKIDSFLVFGMKEHIFITNFSGQIWYRWVNLGHEVFSIKKHGNTLYAVTSDGIWKTDVGVSVVPITSIREEEKVQSIDKYLLFPNPSSGTITIQTETETPYSYLIINQLGETVQSGKVEESGYSHQISVNTLVSGTYTFISQTNGIINKQMFSVIK